MSELKQIKGMTLSLYQQISPLLCAGYQKSAQSRVAGQHY
ncbi:hypothetical protein [Citrobacter braakii]